MFILLQLIFFSYSFEYKCEDSLTNHFLGKENKDVIQLYRSGKCLTDENGTQFLYEIDDGYIYRTEFKGDISVSYPQYSMKIMTQDKIVNDSFYIVKTSETNCAETDSSILEIDVYRSGCFKIEEKKYAKWEVTNGKATNDINSKYYVHL